MTSFRIDRAIRGRESLLEIERALDGTPTAERRTRTWTRWSTVGTSGGGGETIIERNSDRDGRSSKKIISKGKSLFVRHMHT